MFTLKSKSGFPPGGWQYFQPETRWSAPLPLVDGFEATIQKIISHRRQNPRFGLPTDYDTVSHQLETFTCTRLKNHPSWCEDKKKVTAKPIPEVNLEFRADSPDPIVRRVAAKLVGVRNIAGGARILNDWLGNGGVPVDPDKAQGRANICLECPKNTDGGFVASLITKPIAMAIHDQRKLKNDLEMKVHGEDDLHTCAVCTCHLPLKVWVPIQFIQKHTSSDLLREFPDYCWIRKEIAGK